MVRDKKETIIELKVVRDKERENFGTQSGERQRKRQLLSPKWSETKIKTNPKVVRDKERDNCGSQSSERQRKRQLRIPK